MWTGKYLDTFSMFFKKLFDLVDIHGLQGKPERMVGPMNFPRWVDGWALVIAIQRTTRIQSMNEPHGDIYFNIHYCVERLALQLELP